MELRLLSEKLERLKGVITEWQSRKVCLLCTVDHDSP